MPEAEDELHIFPDRPDVVPADLDERILAEHAEGAGDEEQAADAAPGHPAGDEGAHVLDHLHGGQQAAWCGDPGHAAVVHRAAVDDAHRAAHGDRLAGSFEEGPHRAQQRVLFEHGVGIGHAHQG